MKKLIVLSLAGLLILAFGATANAQKLEFRASGFIDTQTFIGFNVPEYSFGANNYNMVNPGFSINNLPNAGPSGFGVGPFGTYVQPSILGTSVAPTGWNKTASNWEGRAHLKFDAVMGPSLSGTIYFEIDTFRWGSAYGTVNSPWSFFSGNGREANNFGGWTTDRTAVEVKNIYVDVGLPYFGIPWPITVRVGAQPIGVRPAMMLYSDGTGVTAGIKAGPVLINPIYAKAVASPDFTHQDSDIWGLQANAKVSTFTVGGYGLYYRMGTYPFFGFSGFTTTPMGLIDTVQGTMKSDMWWLGVYAQGKAGPVDLDFDFVYDLGKVNDEQSAYPHVTYQGFATRLNVEFPWEKFKFGVTGMYASGADARHTDPQGIPGALTSIGTFSKTNKSFVVPPGSEQAAINSESIVVYDMEAGATGGYGIGATSNYYQMGRGGFGGTWFAKAYTSLKLAPWYKLTAQALYIGDTTTHGDTFGTAVKHNGQFKDDQTIGVELDIMQDIQIYKNLRFWMGYGYLFAGKALAINEGAVGGFGLNAGLPPNFTLFPGLNRTPENPWAFRTRLIYTF
ncbi:MAG: hypothetical protein ABSG44_00435 [Thermodesulfobacteriota bacterium]|jgi:hypothetical protein